MVAHVCNHIHRRIGQEDHYEFKSILGYIVSSSPAWTWWDPVSKPKLTTAYLMLELQYYWEESLKKEHKYDICQFFGEENKAEDRSLMTINCMVILKENLVIVWNEDFKHTQQPPRIWLLIEIFALLEANSSLLPLLPWSPCSIDSTRSRSVEG